jgi:hypothetical protein
MLGPVACALALAFTPAAATAQNANDYPVFYVVSSYGLLNYVDDLRFSAYDLDFPGDTEKFEIAIPTGFVLTKARTAGVRLGDATLTLASRAGGVRRLYTGSIRVEDPVAFAADPSTAACAPGKHAATWHLLVKRGSHSLDIPIALDHHAGGQRLTLCFDAVYGTGSRVSSFYFEPDQAFRTPGHAATFLFRATVSPLASAGGPDASQAYEMKAYEPLPQILTVSPLYTPATKTLTVTGVLRTGGRSYAGVAVYVYAGRTANVDAMSTLGHTTTGKGGAYTFTRRLVRAPRFSYADIDYGVGSNCPGSSSAPLGCASYTVDNVQSDTEKVLTAH